MGELRVGKPDTKMDAPSHTRGVNQGNAPGGIERDPGIEYTGESGAGKPTARSTARAGSTPAAGAMRRDGVPTRLFM